MGDLSRRDLFLGGAAALLPLDSPQDQRRLKILCAGGHPDDPESGAGGTMARYADLGHEGINLYFTRGEAGIPGKTGDDAAAIRSAEAEKACGILKVRALFAGQIDGASEISAARYDEVRKILADERPDVVLTHWPIDTHRDHRAISLLIFDGWLRLGKKFALYYFEVNLGTQTQHFHPTHYVDISSTVERKKEACYAHASQNPPAFYDRYHEPMQKHRGMEANLKSAEAFVRHLQSRTEPLP
ncbi:MAG TPA: PIG-L family deacetylase [Planctomycetota bacterium]|jgi:LmbE family N-acetylglucosaminyl deacetylase|nr:PIG-L family deacetylase [Planctomycetota bacterium]